MSEPKICAVCRKPKVEIRGLSMSQWIFHAGSCICDSESSAEIQERTAVQVCGRCKKAITPFRGGSLTQWIFHPAACKCDPKDRFILSTASVSASPFESSFTSFDSTVDEDIDEAMTGSLGLDSARYGVIRQLGEGRNRVYECLDKVLNKRVAVKLLAGSGWNESHIIRFQSEARITAELNHPNLVRLLDFNISQNDQPFVVMELAQGSPLSEFISSRGRVDVLPALNITRQLTDALAYAHSKNIIHRDLKPSNIVISTAGNSLTPLIIDFGIALKGEEGIALEHSYQGHSFFGTPGYLSPEAILGHPVDSRSDVYSLGSVLFEMLTGVRTFHGATVLETIRMQVESGVPRLAESMDGLPIDPAVDTLVAKCLEMNPDERFQSMSEFKDAVIRIEERYLLSTSLAANLAETGSVVDKPVNSKFRSVRILFSLIVVCCLITFSTSLFVSRSPSKPNHRPSVRLLRTDSYDVGLNVDSPAFNISLAPSDLDIIPR
ncbi:MAG: serine/threonine protein kinase, partial [Cyanobacteria bacterium]|nr:serine/threonine protein kinase [Cyanobacteriota bacterium]